VRKGIVSYDPFTAAVPPEKRGPGSDKVPSAGDDSFCTHYGVQDLVVTQSCCLTNRDNNHYAREGNFWFGVSCKECGTLAIEVKKKPNAFGGNVTYMCKMGQRLL
jgi:hypothetical protein